jgi:hypothetical protein
MSIKHAEGKRSPERQRLADAIQEQAEAAKRAASLSKARERANADRFLAVRDVEAADAALKASTPSLDALVEAYVAGRELDSSAMRTAEAEFERARSRLADLEKVAGALENASVLDPNYVSVDMNWSLNQAVADVVAADPAVRRLVENFDKIRRSYRALHSTVRWLVAGDMVPADLKDMAPKASEVYFGAPDQVWLAAVERLARDPDAALPE